MKKYFHRTFFCILITYAGCATTGSTSVGPFNSITGSELKPMGRYDLAGDDLELISSGVHFGVAFEGTSCTVLVSAGKGLHGYLQYELDGRYVKRIRVEGAGREIKIPVLTAGKHSLWIFKATEAHSGPIFIHKVLAPNIKALDIPNRPLIEFIGNSITCGAASDPSEIPCGTGSYHDQHNAYMAYGPRVARALNVNYMLTSVSGIGIYRNWNSDGPVMPQVYEKTDLREESSRLWDFSRYSPLVVSIALGTNDFSNGDGKRPRLPFDSVTFTKNYVDFVKFVKSKYPNARIALLNSPMVSGARNEVFVDCLRRVKQRIDSVYSSDNPVSIFLFKPMKAKGCTGHPDVDDHGRMADEIVGFYRNLLMGK